MPTPTSIRLNPVRLVLRQSSCFYCGGEHLNDVMLLENRVGLRYCAEHKAWAERDVRAHLHETKQVPTREALLHPVLGLFLAALKNPTTIQRSSGDWEDKWVLQLGADCKHMSLVNKLGEWLIPMVNYSSNLAKPVPLSVFQDVAFVTHNPTMPLFDRAAFEAVLDAGLYAAEHAEAEALGVPAAEVEETPGVHTFFANGQAVRAFLPTV